jgi:hypothetical protein
VFVLPLLPPRSWRDARRGRACALPLPRTTGGDDLFLLRAVVPTSLLMDNSLDGSHRVASGLDPEQVPDAS